MSSIYAALEHQSHRSNRLTTQSMFIIRYPTKNTNQFHSFNYLLLATLYSFLSLLVFSSFVVHSFAKDDLTFHDFIPKTIPKDSSVSKNNELLLKEFPTYIDQTGVLTSPLFLSFFSISFFFFFLSFFCCFSFFFSSFVIYLLSLLLFLIQPWRLVLVKAIISKFLDVKWTPTMQRLFLRSWTKLVIVGLNLWKMLTLYFWWLVQYEKTLKKKYGIDLNTSLI